MNILTDEEKLRVFRYKSQYAFGSDADKIGIFDLAAEAVINRLASGVSVEPVAWMHDQGGRVDVIHEKVKELWLRMGQPKGFYREKVPCKVEHYTVPLYALTAVSAARVQALEEAAKFFSENDSGIFWGSQAAMHIRELIGKEPE